MSENLAFHGRTKHNIRIHFIRDLVAGGQVQFKYCNTNEQVADVLTKSLPYEKHVYFRSKLRVLKV